MTDEELEEYLLYHKLNLDNYNEQDNMYYSMLFELYSKKQKYNNIVTPLEMFNTNKIFLVNAKEIVSYIPYNSLDCKYDEITTILRSRPLKVNYKPNTNKIENIIKNKRCSLCSSEYGMPILSFHWYNEMFYGNYYFKNYEDAENYKKVK